MGIPTLTTDELRRCVARLPRVDLAHLPTPLEEVPHFAEHIGGVRIFLKRDDCTGLLFGGNKTRHNEFLLADALHQGADMLVWGAGVQSNNCRQTAAGCAKLGLECRLYLSRAAHPDEVQGNLLLDHLVGAEGRNRRCAPGTRSGGAAEAPRPRSSRSGQAALHLGRHARSADRRHQLRALPGRDRGRNADAGT